MSDGRLSWAELRAETTRRLEAAGVDEPAVAARHITEEASGSTPAEWLSQADAPATERGVAAVDRMAAERIAGRPLQYVVGRWGFRTLDLWVDERALIPRPETELVAGLAVDAARAAVGRHRRAACVVDLGTGTGAIGLAVAAEVDRAEVVITDRDASTLDLARANLAGLGRPATRVTVCEGDWYGALPASLEGTIDVVVSNPPYVAADEVLPEVVADWEPAAALVAGPTGFEDLSSLVEGAVRWLAPGGVLVLEMAPYQAETLRDRAASVGLDEVRVVADLADRDRALVARRPA